MQQIAQAEREFAAASVRNGMRNAFLEYFADDGVNFAPHPQTTRDALLRRGERPEPFVLDWFPSYTDAALAGDMGYNVGPYWLLPRDPAAPEALKPSFGYIFSIWKRQPDGAWRVAVDIGVTTPAPATLPIPKEHAFASPSGYRPDTVAGSVDLEKDLRAAEAGLGKAPARTSYAAALDPKARRHRPGVMPLAGKDAFLDDLAPEQKMEFTVLAAGFAQSADMGYSYGKYTRRSRETPATESIEEQGYYCHLWLKDADGRWRLAVEVLNPLPGGR